MAGSPAQASSGQGTHLVLYDGVCGLCNRLLQFLLEHDHDGVFCFASLQSTAGRAIVKRFGGNPDELMSFYAVANYRAASAQPLSRSDAALFVAGQLGWPWKAAGALGILPRPIREYAYNVIARNRYHVFGRYDRCPVPSPEVRHRFIDVKAE